MAGDISGAREIGEQAIAVLERLSIQEWIDAVRDSNSLITLDEHERSVSPEEALRLRILNARGWIAGLQFRATSRFYKDFFVTISLGVLVGAGLGGLGGLIIGLFVKAVLPWLAGGAVVGAMILGFIAYFDALHTLGMQQHFTDRDR